MLEEIIVEGKLSDSKRQVQFICPFCRHLTPTGRRGKKRYHHYHGVDIGDTVITRVPHCISYLKGLDAPAEYYFKIEIPENNNIDGNIE